MSRLFDGDGSRAALLSRWYEDGYYTKQTFPDAMAEGREKFSHLKTVFYSERGVDELTVSELFDESQKLAGALYATGIRAGDVVAIQVPNWAEGNMMFQATMLLGAVVLPIIHIYGASEVSYILKQSGAKMLVVPDRWRSIDYLERIAQLDETPDLEHIVIIGEKVPPGGISWSEFCDRKTAEFPAPVLDADDVALMVFTSGTTSDPKGVLHSHNSLLAELRAGRREDIDAPQPMVLSPWPAGHIAGVLGVLRLYFMGAEAVLMDAWDASTAATLVERYQVTSSSGTPYFLTSLLDAAEAGGQDISSLKTYLVGAANVPPEVVERCNRLGIFTFRSYGSSEHPTISSGEPHFAAEKRAFTDGTLRRGVEIRLVDDDDRDVPTGTDGEIVSIGPDQFLGYHQAAFNEEAFMPGGWFRTGDIGRLDDEGFLTITDRKKDIIIRGGENIASKEVEDLMAMHPAVMEVSVTAMPDKKLGEKVCAFVLLKPGESLTLEEIRAHFEKLHVAKQKIPERLIVESDLPRTASGKVKKFELRDRLRQEAATTGS